MNFSDTHTITYGTRTLHNWLVNHNIDPLYGTRFMFVCIMSPGLRKRTYQHSERLITLQGTHRTEPQNDVKKCLTPLTS